MGRSSGDMITPFEIRSHRLSEPRKLWVQRADSGDASHCLVFLDAELYLERVNAPAMVGELQGAGRLPPVTAVYVSSLSPAARHVDYTCNETFSTFVAQDLRQWINDTIGVHEHFIICGLSLSGLAAAFTVLRYPAVFDGALCQSPSAWWNDEWLGASLGNESSGRGRFWISVGDKEVQEGMCHPPSGLLQKVSQLDSCRRLAARLAACSEDVRFLEFLGGHDPQCWAEELPEGLEWVLSPSAAAVSS